MSVESYRKSPPQETISPKIDIAFPLPDGTHTLISRCDADLAEPKRYAWYINQNKVRHTVNENGRGKRALSLDREIGGRIAGNPLQRNETVKHLNEDPRDNRRENLLPCTLADLYGSNPERKGFHGITFDKDKGRWNAFFSY